MRKMLSVLFFTFCTIWALAQKKPLTHDVYDGWKSLGERAISNDGKYVAYAINPQEGDGSLLIKGLDNSFTKEIPRGYQARFTEDSRFIIFKIRPLFKETRDAKIKKKRPDEMPKDSLGIIELGKDSVIKIPKVKSFKTPEKGEGKWLAYHLEKSPPDPARPRTQPDSLTQINNLSRIADSLIRVADSLKTKAAEAKIKGLSVLQPVKKEAKPVTQTPQETVEEGTDLVIRNLFTGEEKRFKLVNEYFFGKKGNVCLIETSKKNNDTLSKAMVLWLNNSSSKIDTVMKGFNDAKSYALDENESQLAFVAERDSVTKALRKFYRLWYYKPGMDSAVIKADRTSIARELTISPDFTNSFSKDGSKLFLGLAPIRQPKDTTLVEFETARLDVWHYNDDYLQPQQLLQAQQELRRSYLTVINDKDNKVIQLGALDAENTQYLNEGNHEYVLATSTKGNRVEQQWEGRPVQTAWLISTKDGSRKLIKAKLDGFFSPSPSGKYIMWYDSKIRQYFTYNISTATIMNVTKLIKQPIWDEEDDHPDDPPPHGIAGWVENDQSILIYDKYDIWKVDPDGLKPPVNITQSMGRTNKIEMRYQRLDNEERFLKSTQQLILRAFNTVTKQSGVSTLTIGSNEKPTSLSMLPNSFQGILKAKNADRYIIQKSDIESSELYTSKDLIQFGKLTNISTQQSQYNWLSAELVKWKMFDGKESEGLLFKPENFDPRKKYPVIFYFYERDADGLYNYRAPAPSASTINIPYFVSNGYLVFDPNIYYKDGNPGESAYNSVVSAAKHLAKLPFVDSTKMAIQGQSWGGYQVGYLVTRTKMFAAAGAGAPVANMTSAYGGIRWGSGLNRQFQYERQQSRIGATLWQRRDLYIKNSPLFTADKITTPLLLMHNDKDGAVPWYQGIEFFTALRRLNKKVWLLQYNDEDHNLVERRNRKDLSIRLSQFFDHYLKGAPAPKWLLQGVPAVEKGIDWGTGIVGEQKSF